MRLAAIHATIALAVEVETLRGAEIARSTLFDHLVGASEDRKRDGEAKRL